jgi:hypothetical protein
MYSKYSDFEDNIKDVLWSSWNLCVWTDKTNKYAIHNEIRKRLLSPHLHFAELLQVYKKIWTILFYTGCILIFRSSWNKQINNNNSHFGAVS